MITEPIYGNSNVQNYLDQQQPYNASNGYGRPPTYIGNSSDVNQMNNFEARMQQPTRYQLQQFNYNPYQYDSGNYFPYNQTYQYNQPDFSSSSPPIGPYHNQEETSSQQFVTSYEQNCSIMPSQMRQNQLYGSNQRMMSNNNQISYNQPSQFETFLRNYRVSNENAKDSLQQSYNGINFNQPQINCNVPCNNHGLNYVKCCCQCATILDQFMPKQPRKWKMQKQNKIQLKLRLKDDNDLYVSVVKSIAKWKSKKPSSGPKCVESCKVPLPTIDNEKNNNDEVDQNLNISSQLSDKKDFSMG